VTLHEQGSAEWRRERAGKITGSRFADVLGTRATRARYGRELAFERMAGQPMHDINSRSTTWGNEVEPYQREAFELHTGLVCERVGFITHPRYPFIGISPDSLIGIDSGLEMKSPYDETVQVLTWLDGMPDEHKAQVQGAMFVTGRSHWWFSSYDPRQAEPFRLYVQRIERDNAFINYLAGALLEFNDEVNLIVETIRGKAHAA
jgi:predicted phage-related endonuclease